MTSVVVTGIARTPFGRFGGALKEFSAVDLGAMAVREALHRAQVSPEEVDETYLGSALLGSSTLVVARQINIKAGLPPSTPSLTVDRACCSSMTAVGLGHLRIRAGDSKVVLSGGVDSCSRTPFLQHGIRWGRRLGNYITEDPLLMRNPINDVPVARVTGEVALARGVSREEQDDWAHQSHERYFQALDRGYFDGEVMPVSLDSRNAGDVMVHDESPRRGLKREKLAVLSTVYGSPTVTAGNAPGLNDGASAIVLMSSDEAERLQAMPLCEIVRHLQVAGPLDSSPYLPGQAIGKMLEAAGVRLSDVKRIEINEAFAVMPLVSTKLLADGSAAQLQHLRSITNVHGGAVALGHPPGASGARLVMTVARAVRDAGGGYGVAAICGGFGQADALLVKVD